MLETRRDLGGAPPKRATCPRCRGTTLSKKRLICVCAASLTQVSFVRQLLADEFSAQSSHKDRADNAVETCSILTTTPNAVTAAIHDRMPVILDPDGYDRWLDPGMRDSVLSELLKTYDGRLMRCYPVSTRINHVANDDAECSARVELAQVQKQLFS